MKRRKQSTKQRVSWTDDELEVVAREARKILSADDRCTLSTAWRRAQHVLPEQRQHSRNWFNWNTARLHQLHERLSVAAGAPSHGIRPSSELLIEALREVALELIREAIREAMIEAQSQAGVTNGRNERQGA